MLGGHESLYTIAKSKRRHQYMSRPSMFRRSVMEGRTLCSQVRRSALLRFPSTGLDDGRVSPRWSTPPATPTVNLHLCVEVCLALTRRLIACRSCITPIDHLCSTISVSIPLVDHCWDELPETYLSRP